MARMLLNDRCNQLRVSGKMQEIHWPRFCPTAAEQRGYFQELTATYGFAVFQAVFLSATHSLWLTPLAVVFPILDSIRAANRQHVVRHPVSTSQGMLAATPFSGVWFLAIFLPAVFTTFNDRLPHLYALGLMAFLWGNFAHCLARQFLYYLTANYRVSAQTETKWRCAFRNLWRIQSIPPARADLTTTETAVFQQSLRQIQQYPRRFVILGAGLALIYLAAWNLRLRTAHTLAVVLVIGTLSLLIHSLVDWWRGRSRPQLTWFALQNFLHSPGDSLPEELPPWAPEGPFGYPRIRRDRFLGLAVLTMALAVVWAIPIETSRAVSSPIVESDHLGAASLDVTRIFTHHLGTLAEQLPVFVRQRVVVLVMAISVQAAAMLLLIHWTVGPTLYAGYQLFEGNTAPEHDQREFLGRKFKLTLFDGVSDRLVHSPHEELRQSSFLGWMNGNRSYPVLMASQLWVLGIHVLGAMRSGKTHRFLLPLVIQRIMQRIGPMLIIDLKLDGVLFQAIRRLAEWLGIKFLYFTNVNEFATYLFNPFLQKNFQTLTISQFCEVMVNALNLWHGFSYGKLHFSAQSVGAFAAAMRMEVTGDGWLSGNRTVQVETFDELEERIKRVLKGHPEFGGAYSLVMVIRELANMLQINFASKNSPFPQSAVDAAINLPDIFVPDSNGNYPILICSFRTESQMIASSQLGKLLIHAVKNARIQMMDQFKLGRAKQRPPDLALVIDEWQMLADSSIHNLLEQGAGLGIHFLLANQDISQLERDKSGLLATVWENCATKVIFTARDPALQDRIIKVSGEKTVHVPSYQTSLGNLKAGKVTSDHALSSLNGEELTVMIHETRVPFIERNDLIELSDHPNRFLFLPSQGSSVTQFGGYPVVVESEFALSLEDYKFLEELPWPAATTETIIPADYQSAFDKRLLPQQSSRPTARQKRRWT